MNKYDRIDFVVYDDGYRTYHLTFDGAEANELEVDLQGDLFYNCEFEIVERKEEKSITSVREILDFANEHNINISKSRIGKNYLVIGGSSDTILKDNLEYTCIYDHLCLIDNWNINNTCDFVEVVDNNIYVDGEIIEWW